MPVRDPTNRGGRKRIGWFPSHKIGRMVKWESPLERDYIYYLELDRDVPKYEEQPFTLELPRASGFRQYTPDFLIERASAEKRQVVEVKPEKKLTDPKTRAKLVCAEELLRDLGYLFFIVTDTRIRIQPQLYNLKLLYRFVDYPITLHDQLACLKCFQERDPWRLADLRWQLTNTGLGADVPYALLARGILETPISRRIDAGSMLTISARTAISSLGR